METCVCCKKTIRGHDVFGDLYTPMCWECWSALEWADGVFQHINAEALKVLGSNNTWCLYQDGDGMTVIKS